MLDRSNLRKSLPIVQIDRQYTYTTIITNESYIKL
jgi:hypothetical protein